MHASTSYKSMSGIRVKSPCYVLKMGCMIQTRYMICLCDQLEHKAMEESMLVKHKLASRQREILFILSSHCEI